MKVRELISRLNYYDPETDVIYMVTRAEVRTVHAGDIDDTGKVTLGKKTGYRSR